MIFLPLYIDRTSEPQPILDGEFGEVSSPTFLDELGCKSDETRLIDCTNSRLGFVRDNCACDTCDGVEDLGVRCPGQLL